jgi:hypothetical protein
MSLDALSSFQPAFPCCPVSGLPVSSCLFQYPAVCSFLPCRWLPCPAYLLPCPWLPYQSACACFPASSCVSRLLVLFALSQAALPSVQPACDCCPVSGCPVQPAYPCWPVDGMSCLLVLVALHPAVLSSPLVLAALSLAAHCPVCFSLLPCLWLPYQSACACFPVSGCLVQSACPCSIVSGCPVSSLLVLVALLLSIQPACTCLLVSNCPV